MILKEIEGHSLAAALNSFSSIALNIFSSDVIAATCIAHGRMSRTISPAWPSELEELSGIPWEKIEPCYEKLQSSIRSDNSENLPPHQSASVSINTGKQNKLTISDARWMKLMAVDQCDAVLGKRSDLIADVNDRLDKKMILTEISNFTQNGGKDVSGVFGAGFGRFSDISKVFKGKEAMNQR